MDPPYEGSRSQQSFAFLTSKIQMYDRIDPHRALVVKDSCVSPRKKQKTQPRRSIRWADKSEIYQQEDFSENFIDYTKDDIWYSVSSFLARTTRGLLPLLLLLLRFATIHTPPPYFCRLITERGIWELSTGSCVVNKMPESFCTSWGQCE
jgi:hypothetical protein